MEQDFTTSSQQTKSERYTQFIEQYAYLAKGEKYEVSLLANTAGALHDAFRFFWVGFYLVEDGQLILGSYQGSVACSTIQKGKGVCGTAWESGQIQLVPDVDLFPGHIACSSLSRSEIVLPIRNSNTEVIGVLDIDSDQLNYFDETDSHYLNIIIKTLEEALNRIKCNHNSRI